MTAETAIRRCCQVMAEVFICALFLCLGLHSTEWRGNEEDPLLTRCISNDVFIERFLTVVDNRKPESCSCALQLWPHGR